MRIIETPERSWCPWEIEVDESAERPVKIRPECLGMDLTGHLELEYSYPDYTEYGTNYYEREETLPVEVLVAALERMGYEVKKRPKVPRTFEMTEKSPVDFYPGW